MYLGFVYTISNLDNFNFLIVLKEKILLSKDDAAIRFRDSQNKLLLKAMSSGVGDTIVFNDIFLSTAIAFGKYKKKLLFC